MRNKIKNLTAVFGALVILIALGTGCDSGDVVGTSGTVTLTKEQGVEFIGGTVQATGNYKDSDLIARVSGNNMSLVTGGDSPTNNRPINWFFGGGGIMQRFDSLADVPTVAPDDTMTQPNLAAKTGHGFVVRTSKKTWTRGWISAADSTSVTIQFEHLDAPTAE